MDKDPFPPDTVYTNDMYFPTADPARYVCLDCGGLGQRFNPCCYQGPPCDCRVMPCPTCQLPLRVSE